MNQEKPLLKNWISVENNGGCAKKQDQIKSSGLSSKNNNNFQRHYKGNGVGLR